MQRRRIIPPRVFVMYTKAQAFALNSLHRQPVKLKQPNQAEMSKRREPVQSKIQSRVERSRVARWNLLSVLQVEMPIPHVRPGCGRRLNESMNHPVGNQCEKSL